MEPSSGKAAGTEATNAVTVNVVQKSNAVGICALIFSILAIFLFTLVFMPIGLILAIIAMVKKQYVFGICALIACIIAVCTSPVVWAIFAAFLV